MKSYYSSRLERSLMALLFGVFVALNALCDVQAATHDTAKADEIWQSFRTSYPYHIQVIALSEPLDDRSRVLIVSEPPPSASMQYFDRFARANDGLVAIKQHRVGYDGWVQDVVITLPSMNETQVLELLGALHLDLFGTTYKANVLRLPLDDLQRNNHKLDHAISVSDLYRWTEEDVQFIAQDGVESKSLSAILNRGETGVFWGENPGLLIWSIPIASDLNDFRVEGRQFFLDTDLILGAVGNGSHVAIIGRERVESVLRMPPLRMETVLRLAAEESSELAQSYERNQLYAGKLESGSDWAPIYLSDILIDSEFGSLLNITDQLLKSWSMAGAIRYVNFDYPDPSAWPAFQPSIREVIDEQGSFTFNWNTDGAGYTTFIGDLEYLAFHRTGALPITYLVGEESALGDDEEQVENPVQAHENVAYDYFAGLDNPDLARVVQYTGLYQIFFNYGVTTRAMENQIEVNRAGSRVMEQETRRLLNKILNLSEEEFVESFTALFETDEYKAEFIASVDEATINELIASFEAEGIPIDDETRKELEDPEKLYEFFVALYALSASINASELISTLQVGQTIMQDEALDKLAELVADQNAYFQSLSTSIAEDLDEDAYFDLLLLLATLEDEDDLSELTPDQLNILKELWVITAYEALIHPENRDWLLYFVDREEIKEKYANALSHSPDGWIKTASIVLSHDTEDVTSVGGHNIGARTMYFEPSTSVARGTVEVTEYGVRYNPADVNKIHEFSRIVRREQDASASQLKTILQETIERTPVRSQSLEALNVSPNRPVRGGSADHMGARALSQNPSWFRRTSRAAEKVEFDAAASLDGRAVVIERIPEGYSVMYGNNARVVEAHSLSSFREVLQMAMKGQSSNARLSLKGFNAEEARSLMQTEALRTVRGEKIITTGRGTLGRSVEFMKSNYDWSKATIKAGEVENVTSGVRRGLKRQTFDVTVPSVQPSKPSLLMRIVAFFSDTLPASVKRSIESVLAKFRGELPTQRVINELKRELEMIDGVQNVEFHADAEGVIIAEKRDTKRDTSSATYEGP